ncbi:cupin domain-containing protein [Luteimonas salinilitoris]|uniref:Cupin domain-containing protein n=1 Tax=Luteimonas salinilitoris TaxID=3237697 RepID=A0ABV4HRD0_9GAMM
MNKRLCNRSAPLAAATFAIGLAVAGFPSAGAEERGSDQNIQGITWTVLEQHALAGAPENDEVVGVAEIAPGNVVELHNHSENEVGYLLEGEFTLEREGQPDMTVKTGQSFAIKAGVNHRAKNDGDEIAKVLVFYIVGKGQPLAKPAK